VDRSPSYSDANAVQRGLRRFASSGPGSWVFARVAHRIDRPVYKVSGGRWTFASAISGLPVVMLTTTGAKSGLPRTVPVLGLPVDSGMVVIASNFGQHRQPAWHYNLQARPEGEIAVRGISRPFRARVAEGEERERIWRQGLEVYPGWSQYEERASHRRIHVYVLETG